MAATNLAADGRARRGRLQLEGGAGTTVYVACHGAGRTEIRVAIVNVRLEPGCARHGVRDHEVLEPGGRPLATALVFRPV